VVEERAHFHARLEHPDLLGEEARLTCNNLQRASDPQTYKIGDATLETQAAFLAAALGQGNGDGTFATYPFELGEHRKKWEQIRSQNSSYLTGLGRRSRLRLRSVREVGPRDCRPSTKSRGQPSLQIQNLNLNQWMRADISQIDSPPQNRMVQTSSCPQGMPRKGSAVRLTFATPNSMTIAATASSRYGKASS